MSENLEALDQYVRTCIAIFIALMALTVITVAVSFLEVPTPATISIALVIAMVKGSLVCAFFMHLISEKKVIYLSLGLTLFFFIALMLMPIATDLDQFEQVIVIKH